MKWKLSNFSDLKQDCGAATSVYSAPFYTSKNGYKMRLQLYINGYKEGQNSHLSLFIVVIKGEHDDVLPWPLTIQVSFTLLNMANGANHTFMFSPGPFTKPTFSEFDGAEAGFSQFIGHKYVQPFIKNNRIFITCKVKVIGHC